MSNPRKMKHNQSKTLNWVQLINQQKQTLGRRVPVTLRNRQHED
ncbi:MAG: hypothetical protein WCP85_30470 [Mariniphaga sp.]